MRITSPQFLDPISLGYAQELLRDWKPAGVMVMTHLYFLAELAPALDRKTKLFFRPYDHNSQHGYFNSDDWEGFYNRHAGSGTRDQKGLNLANKWIEIMSDPLSKLAGIATDHWRGTMSFNERNGQCFYEFNRELTRLLWEKFRLYHVALNFASGAYNFDSPENVQSFNYAYDTGLFHALKQYGGKIGLHAYASLTAGVWHLDGFSAGEIQAASERGLLNTRWADRSIDPERVAYYQGQPINTWTGHAYINYWHEMVKRDPTLAAVKIHLTETGLDAMGKPGGKDATGLAAAHERGWQAWAKHWGSLKRPNESNDSFYARNLAYNEAQYRAFNRDQEVVEVAYPFIYYCRDGIDWEQFRYSGAPALEFIKITDAGYGQDSGVCELYTVNNSRVNIRPYPSTDNTPIRIAQPGETYHILGRTSEVNFWYKIWLPAENVEGWIVGYNPNWIAIRNCVNVPIVDPTIPPVEPPDDQCDELRQQIDQLNAEKAALSQEVDSLRNQNHQLNAMIGAALNGLQAVDVELKKVNEALTT